MPSDSLKITLVKSQIGALPKQKKVIKALGLGKLNSFVIQKNNPAILGMVNKISHMVRVEELQSEGGGE